MNSAKESFLERIEIFSTIVSPSDGADGGLMSRELTERIHNEKVRMLRNGMAIIGYTILEDFIKKRTGEVLQEIGTHGVVFDTLPTAFKDAVIFKALGGIQERASNLKRNTEDYLGFIQDQAERIASTKNDEFELSAYSLGWDKSNLSAEDLKMFLKVFNVKDGWNAIQKISSKVYISLINPSEAFSNLARRRHRAAHNAETESLLTDLVDLVSQAKVIAFAYDSLISMSSSKIKVRDAINPVDADELTFRFVVKKDGVWKEYINNFDRAYRSNADYSTIKDGAVARSRAQKNILLIKSEDNIIQDWSFFY